jgi:hypothetical protein
MNYLHDSLSFLAAGTYTHSDTRKSLMLRKQKVHHTHHNISPADLDISPASSDCFTSTPRSLPMSHINQNDTYRAHLTLPDLIYITILPKMQKISMYFLCNFLHFHIIGGPYIFRFHKWALKPPYFNSSVICALCTCFRKTDSHNRTMAVQHICSEGKCSNTVHENVATTGVILMFT